VRTVRRPARDRAADVLSAIPAELHGPLLALARGQADVDDARRELTMALVHTPLRWRDVDPVVRKLQCPS
jgi:hypothetical protein